MDWQPIETAPKDGTSILVYDKGWMFVARWSMYDGCGATPEGGVFMSTSCVDGYTGTTRATHWMHLPEPPK
jgi:hypothetical protein